MKRFFLLFAVLCCTMMVSANVPLPTDEIWYTSTDGQVVYPNRYAFGATNISNTYQNGKDIIKFNVPVSSIGNNAFSGCNSLASITIPNSITGIEKKHSATVRNCLILIFKEILLQLSNHMHSQVSQVMQYSSCQVNMR